MGIELEKQESLPYAPSFRQLNGQGKGRIFEMNAPRITIGRTDDNHIVLVDESISRVHAMLELSEGSALVVYDNESRNGVLVNGKKVEASSLKNGDQLQIGNIAFQIFIPNSGRPLADGPQLAGQPNAAAGGKPTLNKRFILYGGAGLILVSVFVLNQNPEESKKKETLKAEVKESTKTELIAEPNSNPIKGLIDPTKDPIESELEKLPWNDTGISESEAYFRRGQRELNNKNFQRAINSFQLALSLNKNHVEAQVSLADAVKASDEDAKNSFEKGIKYYQALQYQRAIYFFQQAQASLGHRPGDPLISKAEEKIRLARQRLKAADLFP